MDLSQPTDGEEENQQTNKKTSIRILIDRLVMVTNTPKAHTPPIYRPENQAQSIQLN